MDKQIYISAKSIFPFFLFIGAIFVVYKLRSIIGLVLVATLIVLSIEPLVKRIMGLKLLGGTFSRTAAVLTSFVIFIGSVVAIITLGLPPIVVQSQKLIANIYAIEQEFTRANNLNIAVADLLPVSDISQSFLSITVGFFSNLATLFTLLIISIYMSLDWPHIKKKFVSLFPSRYAEDALDTIVDIETNVGQWIKGELFLMTVIGVFSFVGLTILDIDYALVLALIAGLLEIVPIIGPVLAAVVAGVIGFSDSPIKGVGVVALFTIIQQLENNLLVPKVMGKVSGFSPLIILVGLMVGADMFGIVGAIVAVPVIMIAAIILKRVLRVMD